MQTQSEKFYLMLGDIRVYVGKKGLEMNQMMTTDKPFLIGCLWIPESFSLILESF
jgi:hypothetical protein